MKILFDATPLTGSKSGVGYFTERLVESLASTYPNKLDLSGHYFNFLGRNHVTLSTKPNLHYTQSRLLPGRALGLLRKLNIELPFELITGQKADVVLFPNFISAPTSRQALNVVVIYDLSFIDCPQFTSDKLRANLQKWVEPSIKRADLVITISDFTKRRINEYYKIPEDNILVVPIPPKQASAPNESILKRLMLDAGFLLFVGNIEPRKNLVNLIKAYELLPKELQKLPLVLAGGKGWHDEEILATIEGAQQKGLNIISTGYITDEEKSALYHNGTLVIQPSHYEGFGMPVLEAMSYGKPVICSDIEVLREVASDGAAYFDKDDPQKIALSIQENLEPTKLNNLAKKGQARVQQYPSWDEIAKNIYERFSLELKKRA